MSTRKVEVTGFDNRGPVEHPFGFIEFSDGMRIGYAPGTNGANEDGLFNCQQPYLIEQRGLELRAAHVSAATKYVRETLRPATEKLAEAEALEQQAKGQGDEAQQDDYEATTGHLFTCLAAAGGEPDPDCPCAVAQPVQPETDEEAQ